MNCPKCVGKLQKTEIRQTATSELKGLAGASTTLQLQVDKCFACGGIWFDRGELDKYLTEGMTILDSPALGGSLDRELDEKRGNCPRCGIAMMKAPASGVPGVTVDVCGQCKGIWLDPTEITRLESAHKPKKGFLEMFFKAFQRPE